MDAKKQIEVMNRVRRAIKEHDPSYILKRKGIICAKEWVEIMPPPLDFIWGKGYTWAIRRINDELKVEIFRKAAKNTIKLDGSRENIGNLAKINAHHIDWDIAKGIPGVQDFDVVRYMMNDVIRKKGVSS